MGFRKLEHTRNKHLATDANFGSIDKTETLALFCSLDGGAAFHKNCKALAYANNPSVLAYQKTSGGAENDTLWPESPKNVDDAYRPFVCLFFLSHFC